MFESFSLYLSLSPLRRELKYANSLAARVSAARYSSDRSFVPRRSILPSSSFLAHDFLASKSFTFTRSSTNESSPAAIRRLIGIHT